MNNWADRLKPILTDKIEEAIGQVALGGEPDGILFPIMGDNCCRHMADAAIAVLLSIEDAQEYLKRELLLKD